MKTKHFIMLLLVCAVLASIVALTASAGEVNNEIPAQNQ
jgi:hypothetical protein